MSHQPRHRKRTIIIVLLLVLAIMILYTVNVIYKYFYPVTVVHPLLVTITDYPITEEESFGKGTIIIQPFGTVFFYTQGPNMTISREVDLTNPWKYSVFLEPRLSGNISPFISIHLPTTRLAPGENTTINLTLAVPEAVSTPGTYIGNLTIKYKKE